MKLSMGMIVEELGTLIKCEAISAFTPELGLCRYAFFNNDKTLYSDTLYIIDESQQKNIISSDVKTEPETYLFLYGNKNNISTLKNATILSIDTENISLFAFVNKISEIFEKYRNLEFNLLQAVTSRGSMQQLVTLATPLFDNEITVRDRNHRYIAQSYKTIKFSTMSDEAQPDRNGYSSNDEIYDLKNETDYREEHSTNLPWIYARDGYHLLCYDIFIENRFIYRIKITDINHPFKEYDSELLIYFAKMVKEKYINLSMLYPERQDEFATFLKNLLQNDMELSDNELQSQLDNFKWKMDHCYLYLCMRHGNSKGVLKAYSYYCRILNERYKSTYSIEYQGKIVLIANLSIKYNNRPDLLMSELILFLRDENFRAGVSMSSYNIKDSVYLFKQASKALELGMTYTPSLWRYSFKDYRFEYLYKMLSDDLPTIAYLMPELHKLYQIDQENQTEYINTLRSYLENNRNITKAAKKLNIHRSTMEYRLQKMEELTDLNCENGDDFLLANFLLRISDCDKKFL